MARRKQREHGLDIFLAAPWWVSAVMAVGGFAAFQWIIPASATNNPLLKMVSQATKPVGYVFLVVFGLIAVVNFFRQRSSPPIAPASEPVVAGPTAPRMAVMRDEGLEKAWIDLMAKPRQSQPRPTEWSIELLRMIEWKRFEELCAAFYREIGLRSETIRCGADGGVDAKLFQGDSTEPAAIVQCKAWNSRPVGVKPVRELLGVMTHQKVPKGIFIATGEFTKEAVEFAQANPLDLVSGVAFMGMLKELSVDARQRLLAVATEGNFTTPSCPSCGIKMNWRTSDQGNFWGCENFPRCKQKFFAKVSDRSLPDAV